MYIKKTIGHIIGTQNRAINLHEKSSDKGLHKVVKSGRILTLKEERISWNKKSVNIASIANRGFDYYQVISNQGACEKCEDHNGAIYPVTEGKEYETLPPFHPNCKCTIQGFSTKNPNHDPWLSETIFWLEIMYGDGTLEQKAQKILDFYHWTEFSVKFIVDTLKEVADIEHIGKRMKDFFDKLENPNKEINGLEDAQVAVPITSDDLSEFGWYNATQDEAERLMTSFRKFGITSRESMLQFIAIAAAESGYGQQYLEIGNDDYWEAHGYDRNTRGAGYIQVTHDYNHQAFLDFIGDDYNGADTASYIAENYALEVSVWFWSQLNLYGYEGGVNEFIETKIDDGGDSILIFLKTAYYVGGMPSGDFNSDINDAIAGNIDYEITDTHLIINGNKYLLPSRWDVRLEAYQKAQEIW